MFQALCPSAVSDVRQEQSGLPDQVIGEDERIMPKSIENTTETTLQKHKMCFINWLRCEGDAKRVAMMTGAPNEHTFRRWMMASAVCKCKWHGWADLKARIENGDIHWMDEDEKEEVQWALLPHNKVTREKAPLSLYVKSLIASPDFHKEEYERIERAKQLMPGNTLEEDIDLTPEERHECAIKAVKEVGIEDLIKTIDGFRELMKTEGNKYKFLQNFENYIIKRVSFFLSYSMKEFNRVMAMNEGTAKTAALKRLEKENPFVPHNMREFIKIMEFLGDEKRKILGIGIPDAVQDLIDRGFLDKPEPILEDPETKEGIIQPADDEVAQLLRAATLKADQVIEQEKIGKILEFKKVQ